MSDARKRYISPAQLLPYNFQCVLCGNQERLQEATPSALEKAGWEDMGDGLICRECVQQMTLNWELLLQEHRKDVR